MSLGGLLNGMIQPSRDMMVRAVTPAGSFGKVFGFVSTGFNFGGVVAPLLYGWLMDRGQPRMIFVIVIVFILLALVTAITRAKPQGKRRMDSLPPPRPTDRRSPAATAPLAAGRAVERDHRLPARPSLGARLPARPVPAGTLETLVAAAQWPPTSSNMQFWSAIAVTDPALKRKVLAEIAGDQKHIEQCPLYICWVADLSRNQRVGETENRPFESMPWLETFMVACIDAALAAQNAVVAAQSIGLRTVYIGAMRNDPVRVAELFGPAAAGLRGVRPLRRLRRPQGQERR